MEQLDKFMVAGAISDVIEKRYDTTREIFAAYNLVIAGVDGLTPDHVRSPDAGFVLILANGAEYAVTIVRRRCGRTDVSVYQQMIRESMGGAGRVGAADPRHVEAWMRLEHGCLDGLSAQQFTEEVTIAVQCVAARPLADSEALAASFGL